MTADQLDLFDLSAGRAARDAAVAAVADPPWQSFAVIAVETVACAQGRVTSDDVWAELDRMGIPRPPEGRAMGPVMTWAVRSGLLTPEGYTQGTNPRHHADVMRVYRSLVAA